MTEQPGRKGKHQPQTTITPGERERLLLRVQTAARYQAHTLDDIEDLCGRLTWALGTVTRVLKELDRVENITGVMAEEISRLRGSDSP